jgi:hypothetical protein
MYTDEARRVYYNLPCISIGALVPEFERIGYSHIEAIRLANQIIISEDEFVEQYKINKKSKEK